MDNIPQENINQLDIISENSLLHKTHETDTLFQTYYNYLIFPYSPKTLEIETNQISLNVDTIIKTPTNDKKAQILYTNLKLNPNTKMPKDPMKSLELLNRRLFEYSEVSKYFNKYKLKSQFEDTQEKIKQILSLIYIVKEKKQSINQSDIPNPITSDYICGCSKSERLKKFVELEFHLINRKNELLEEILNFESKVNKKLKITKSKRQTPEEKLIEERKKKLDETEKVLSLLYKQRENPWIPPPLFENTIIEESIAITNEKINPYTLRIFIGKTTYDKNGVSLHIDLIGINNQKLKNRIVELKELQVFNKVIEMKFTPEEFDFLAFYTLKVKMFRKE